MPPVSRLKLADATEHFVGHFKSLQLKKDFNILAGEIRRHQNIVREAPAPFLAALGDVSSWGETHCQGAGTEP
jgi:hypothetical protein